MAELYAQIGGLIWTAIIYCTAPGHARRVALVQRPDVGQTARRTAGVQVSVLCYQPVPVSSLKLDLMTLLDRQYAGCCRSDFDRGLPVLRENRSRSTSAREQTQALTFLRNRNAKRADGSAPSVTDN